MGCPRKSPERFQITTVFLDPAVASTVDVGRWLFGDFGLQKTSSAAGWKLETGKTAVRPTGFSRGEI